MTNSPTPPGEWRPTLLYHFRSGHTALLQPVGLDLFIRVGRVPNSLESIVVDMFKSVGERRFDIASLQDIRDIVQFLDQLCIAVFVAPKVVEGKADYEAGQISVDDIPYMDKEEVLDFFNDPTRALAAFRPKPIGDVESVPHLQNTRSKTKRAPKNKRMGGESTEITGSVDSPPV